MGSDLGRRQSAVRRTWRYGVVIVVGPFPCFFGSWAGVFDVVEGEVMWTLRNRHSECNAPPL